MEKAVFWIVAIIFALNLIGAIIGLIAWIGGY